MPQQNELRALFQQHATRPAVTSLERGTENYGQLSRRVTTMLSWLNSRGITPGDTLCLYAKNHPLWVDLFFAALYGGYRLAPINWRLPTSEIAPLLTELSPSLILSDQACLSVAQQFNDIAPCVSIERYNAEASVSPYWPELNQPRNNDCVMLLKTGGTTGRSRWAKQRFEQIALNALHTANVFGLDANDCVVQATPLFHAGANALATPLLLSGGHVVLAANFTVESYLQHVQEHQASVIFGVPSVYQMLLGDENFNAKSLDHIRVLLCGGAPCPRRLAQQLGARGFTVKQGFGMTEAGVNCFRLATVATPKGAQGHPADVGMPMPHIDMRIVDGELEISGAALFGGYLGDSEVPQRLRTGDLFRQTESGSYIVQGRKKEMYISGGENVFPVEVENHLADLSLITNVAVVGVSCDTWGETGLAACVVSQATSADHLKSEISNFLATRLATYKMPKHVLILHALPLTPAGKVDKKAIAALWKLD